MTKILILSDLHLEFDKFIIPELDNEKEIVIILAGDIGVAKKEQTYHDFIKDTCDRFKDVIYIMGNHEFYNGNMGTSLTKIQESISEYENIHVVEKETVIIDDIAFICATLWTNMDNNNHITMYEAGLYMNDYHCVRFGPKNEPWKRKLKPLDTMADHKLAVKYIFSEIIKQKENGKKVVVVTHHLPSFKSIPEQFKGERLSGAYASELFKDIMNTQPDIWIHGHTHASMDYMIGDTRILCNPRGYVPQEPNYDFDPTFIVEI